MKIIQNTLIPGKNYFALDFFGVIFVRKDSYQKALREHPWYIDQTIRHESIHNAQMKDFCRFCFPLGAIIFYIVYLTEWFIRLFPNKFNSRKAYKQISFEREAYKNENVKDYLSTRKRFAQWK